MLTKKEMEGLESYFRKILSNQDVAVKAGFACRGLCEERIPRSRL